MIKRSRWTICSFPNPDKEEITGDSSIRGLSTIAKGGIVNLIGLLFSLVLNFSYQFVLIRIFSPAEVGLFNLGVTIIGIVGLIIIFGMDRAVVRQIAHFMGTKKRELELGVVPTAVRIMLLLTVLIIPICWLVAEPVAELVFNKPSLGPILKILLISVPFAMLTRLTMGVLQAYKLMKPLVLIEQVINPLLRLLGMVILILVFSQTLAWISISYTLTIILGCGIAITVFYRYYLSRRGNFTPAQHYPDLLKYSWPLFGASLLNRTNTYTETLMLGGLSSSEQVGLFTVSFKLAVTLAIIYQASNTVIAPFIAEMFAKADNRRLSHQFKSITRWGFTLALPLALIMCLNANDIVTVLNPEYFSGVPVLQVLSLSQLMYVIVGPVALILTMTNYVRLNLVDLILTLILSIVLDIILIPRYGAFGAAIAGAISIIFINLLRLIQVYKLFGIHPYNLSYLKPLLASVLAILSFFGTSQLMLSYSALTRLFLTSVVFLIVYGCAILLFRQDETDREVFQLIFRDAFKIKKSK